MKRAATSDRLIEAGTWIIDRTNHPHADCALGLAHAVVDVIPASATLFRRRAVLLLNLAEQKSEDHGRTRWWLHGREIPFLEVNALRAPRLAELAPYSTILIADTSRADVPKRAVETVRSVIAAGATAIAFGDSGRLQAESLSFGGLSAESLADGSVEGTRRFAPVATERWFRTRHRSASVDVHDVPT
jgi:hypothetical protein